MQYWVEVLQYKANTWIIFHICCLKMLHIKEVSTVWITCDRLWKLLHISPPIPWMHYCNINKPNTKGSFPFHSPTVVHSSIQMSEHFYCPLSHSLSSHSPPSHPSLPHPKSWLPSMALTHVLLSYLHMCSNNATSLVAELSLTLASTCLSVSHLNMLRNCSFPYISQLLV